MTDKRFSRQTEMAIRAICADYPRRARILAADRVPQELKDACGLLNRTVDEATALAYDLTRAWAENFCEVLREDIAQCRGYARSPLSGVMSEGSYKKYKHIVKREIARRLCL